MTDAMAFRQGVHLFRQGRYDEAAAALAEAAGRASLLGKLSRHYLGRAHYQAGLALARAGRLYDALMRLRQARQVLGDRASLAVLLAQLCQAAGSPDRAEAQLQAAGAGGEGAAKVELDLADLQLRAGRPQQAALTLHDALRRHPQDSGLHLRMGLLLAQQEQYWQAKKHLLRCVELASDSADAHYWLGMCEAALDAPAAAATHLGRACALRPDQIVWAYQLALASRAAAQRGLPVELPVAAPLSVPDRASLAGLVEQISRDSEMVLAMLQLPENDADDELFGALSGLLELALEQHEARADLHHRQALVLDRLGRQDEAIAHARRAVEINPQFVQAHILLGSLLMGRQPQAAESHLRQAVASGGDYADVHLRLADLARQAGNLEQARAELARALEINGNYEQAKAALADLAA